jgi:hypothetical protein
VVPRISVTRRPAGAAPRGTHRSRVAGRG